MPKRRDDVAPPPGKGQWRVRFGTGEAASSWEELGRQLPGSVLEAWGRMRSQPLERTDTQKPLSGDLGSRSVGGAVLPQWQIDISSGGRIWYCVEDKSQTVWVMLASARHPQATASKAKRAPRNR